jgi:hypothetical protein
MDAVVGMAIYTGKLRINRQSSEDTAIQSR